MPDAHSAPTGGIARNKDGSLADMPREVVESLNDDIKDLTALVVAANNLVDQTFENESLIRILLMASMKLDEMNNAIEAYA
ncbi:MAG: hypothetical protein K2X42_07890 [Burkholderiaceae bacterium]|nr:hypothetical protein [Burkholderiaceae bacterium]